MANIVKNTSGTDLTLGPSWLGGAEPTSADVAVWVSGSVGGSLTLPASRSWQGINISAAPTSAISVTGAGTLTVGVNGVIIDTSALDVSWGTTVSLGNNQTWNVGAGRVLTASGQLTGSGTLAKSGTGSLFLTGSGSTNSGAVTLNAGSLFLAGYNSGTPNQLANVTTLTLSGGVLYVAGNIAYATFSTLISGSQDLYMINSSSGGVTFTGTSLSNYNGSLRLYGDSTTLGLNTAQKITTTALASSNFFFLTGGGLSSQVSQTLVYNGTSALAYGNAILILPQSGPGITAKIENASSNNTAISFSGTLSNNGTSAYATSIEFATTNANITHSGNITEASTGTLNLSKTNSNALTLSGSTSTYKGTVSVSAGTLNANSATALGAANSTAGISVSSGATLSLGAAVNYSSSGRSTTISGVGVSGVDAGCLVLADAGPLNLGAINATNNTYIRGTTTTQLTSAIAWSGSGGLRLGAATGTTATFSGAISVSSGTLTAILFGRSNNPDLGTVVLGATNTFTAPTQIDFGTLRISADANLGTAPGVATAAYLIVGGNTTLATTATFTLNANRGIALGPSSGSGTGTIDVASATTLTYPGIVANNSTGTGALVKANTGTLILGGANTYSGGTTIRAGTVVAGNANALGSSGTVTLNDASTGSSNTTLSIDATAGNVTVARAITVANQGTGTTSFASASTGGANIARFSGAVTLAKSVTIDGGSAGNRLDFSGGISGTGNVTIAGTTRVIYLTTANTYAGTTTINSGAKLQLSDGTSTSVSFLPDGYSVAVNGTLNFAKGANSETIDALTGSGVVDNPVGGAATLIVGSAGGSGSFSGIIQNTVGTLGLTKQGAGTQTLTGANTYTGATTVSGGTLSFFGSGASLGGGTYAGAITNDGILTFFTSVAHTLSGTISGTGKLSNGGAGTLTLSAATGNKSTANALAGGGAFSFLTIGSAYSLSGNMSELEGAVGLVSGTSGSRTVVACSASALGSTLMTMTLNNYGVYLISNDEGAVTATHNIGSLSSSFSTSIIAGSGFVGTRTGTKTLSVGALNASTTYAGVIADQYSGGGSVVAFTKVGTGTQTLSGTNTYTGAVAVNAGTLVAGSSTALGAASSAAGVSVANNATLRLNDAATYASRTLTLTGSGVGGITGALVLANTGTNTFGGISLLTTTGQINATASATLSAPITTNNLALVFNAATGAVFTLDSVSVIGASASQVLFNSLTSSSLGTVVVSAQNLYTGNTTVSRGELRVAASSTGTPGSVTSGPLGRGTLEWNNGTLDVSSSITLHNAVSLLGDLVFTGAYALTLAGAFSVSGSRVLTTNGTGGALTVSGALSGTISDTLTKAGTNTLAFSSASTFAGSVVVTDGVLVAGNTAALGTGAGVTLSAGATLHVLTTGNGGIQNGRLTIASLNNATGGTIKIGG